MTSDRRPSKKQLPTWAAAGLTAGAVFAGTIGAMSVLDRQADSATSGTSAPAVAGTSDEGGHTDAGSASTHLAGHTGMAHPEAMALVAPELATHVAVADGAWSNPATWGGDAPTDGARVHIPEGRDVIVDSIVSTRIETIGVHGTLRFATDVDTELNVDTIVSSPRGRVEIGTPEQPIAADVLARIRFIDDGPIDRSVDPSQLGRGALLHGATVMHGEEVHHRTTLVEAPQAGDTQIRLRGELAGWGLGDQIVITGTQGPTSDEVRKVAAIDGSTVTLDAPLDLDHIPPRADLSVWVANTTRNIVIESENHEFSRRGHVMFMHTHAVDVRNVRFDHLGRTDKSIELDDVDFGESGGASGGHLHDGEFALGPATNIRARYSVHVHRGGTDPNGPAAHIEGSVVFDDPGWGFVNHSSNVDFVDNVSYEARGVGFMTEAGDEVGSMIGNIAIRSVMPNFTLDDGGALDPDLRAEQQDFGWQGDGFWLQGNRVSVVDNVSAGASAHGIIFWSEGLIELAPDPNVATTSTVAVATLPDPSLVPDRDRLEVWWAPAGEIRNNESYGATVGFRSRYIHGGTYLEDENPPPQAYIDTLAPVVDGLLIWDVRDGVLLNYNERLSLRNADIIGRGDPFDHNLFATAAIGVGVDFGNEVTRGPGVIENVKISGFEMGIIMPRNGEWVVTNLDLANTTDMLIHETRLDRNLVMSDVEFGSLDGTAVADRADRRQHVVMDPWFEGIDEEPNALFGQDRIALDGEGIYFDIQAIDAVPVTAGRLGVEDGEEFDEDEEKEGEAFDDEEFEHEDDHEDDAEFDGDGEEFEGTDGLDRLVLGLTNRQLIDRFGVSFGGTTLPTDARTAPWLVGGVVGEVAPPSTTTPSGF